RRNAVAPSVSAWYSLTVRRTLCAMLIAGVASGCFVMSPVKRFGGGKSAEQSQREGLSKLMPAQIGTETPWKGTVAEAKIRVWADDEYRAQNVHWQQRFGEQLEYANEVLAAMFGVRLVPEYRAWDHRALPGSTLDRELDELARNDSGD